MTPSRRALILLYHRVNEKGSDPWDLVVSPRHFREHLDVVWRLGRPMRLTEMVRSLRAGEEPRNGIALTFDDGYADVVENAIAPLEACDVPATFFLTTGAIGSRHEFWWDELERLVLQPTSVPERLTLDVDGTVQHWSLQSDQSRPAAESQRDREWRAWLPAPPTRRHAVFQDLWECCHRLPTQKRAWIIDQLRKVMSHDTGARASHRLMTADEARRIAQGDLFEIGAHSVTHAALAFTSREEQAREIHESKRWLEECLAQAVTMFAYPYGQARHYDADTVRIVQQAGFEGACVNVAGTVGRGTGLYELPRLFVQDWDGDEFARQLLALYG